MGAVRNVSIHFLVNCKVITAVHKATLEAYNVETSANTLINDEIPSDISPYSAE